MITVGSLFSGIGGLELGLEWAGLGPVRWQVEVDPFCRSVLARHWPEVERYGDICTVGATELAPVDLICGGFPCQDTSSAGKGAGLAGHRSGLWYEFARIAGELRPKWLIIENVTSGGSRWVDTVVRDLDELGYGALPVPLSASDVGAPHRRGRIFVVAHTNLRELRDDKQRQAGGRHDVRDSGHTVSTDHGDEGDAADADGRGRAGKRESSHRGQRGEPGVLADGRRRSRTEPPDARAPEPGCWSPEPPVCGVDDGPSSGLDRSRLRALGNAVVPQCAEVLGWLVRELDAEFDRGQ